MLQVRVHGPGDVRVDEVPEPDPGPRDVVVRVAACICGSDLSYIKMGGLAGRSGVKNAGRRDDVPVRRPSGRRR